MNRRFLKLMSLALCGAALAFVSCGSNVKKTEKEEALVKAPAFVADSAYAYTAAQVAFGPRTMGSQAHEACADYLEQMLASFGAKVYRQQFEATLYNGERYPAVNLIGAFNPEARKRVMLCSHWDSRPWADNDPDEKNHHTPILGANDGASGVGVLLEMARQMQQQAPEIGVDLIFFDAEDAGVPQFESYGDEDTWCLGSQFWARRPHVPGYNARFGVLLDMVGGSGATFLQEGYSKEYASAAMKKIWKMADRLGYGNYFPSKNGGYVTDDHVPVNQVAKIPCVDIIPCYEHCEQSSFGPYWHTVDDTMEHIDKATLQAVGQTLMEVIYNEK